MARARLHIICGNCGCNSEFCYEIHPKGKDVDGIELPAVFIKCGNCSTLHVLEDTIEERPYQ